MWSKDSEKIQDIFKKCNSPYAACIYVANKARKLQKESYNVLSESDALEWAISGEPPVNLNKKLALKDEKDNTRESSKIDIILSTIDEDYIYEAVLNSYRASSRAKRLVYEYNGIKNKNIRAKIRILTKMAFMP